MKEFGLVQRLVLGSLLVLTVTLVGSLQFTAGAQPDSAQKPQAGKSRRPADVHAPGLRALGALRDLTDQQRQQIRAVRQQHAAELQQIAERLHTTRPALHAATAAEPFDETLVRTKAAELALVQADSVVAHARMQSEILRFLTPEQRERLKTGRERIERRFRDPAARLRSRRD